VPGAAHAAVHRFLDAKPGAQDGHQVRRHRRAWCGRNDPRGRPAANGDIAYSLQEEADTIRWLHDEVELRGELPLLEAESS